jgi:hypothetical protein
MAKSATQSKPNFGSILDQPGNEIERPPLLPRGHYLTVVQSYRNDKANTGTEFTEVTLKVIAPAEFKDKKTGEMRTDVDEDELEEFGEVRDSVISTRFFHTEKSAYRLRQFLEHCGVDFSDGKNMGQGLEEIRNSEIIAFVVHEPWTTGEGVSARVRSTAPVE